jgi:pimeloyl-ACP methyl ester carboxylesterase
MMQLHGLASARTMAQPPAGLEYARPMPHVDGVTHSWRPAGEVLLHVAEAGAGPPLVLLHGYPQHWYIWHRFIPRLAQDYRVICPDLRGFGWSQAPPGGYGKETLMRDVLALLDAMNIERFRVAGHDWGGWISMLLGILHAGRVERLMAMSQMPPFFTFGHWARNAWHLWHGMTLGAPGVGPRAARRSSAIGQRVFRWLGSDQWTSEEQEIFLGQFDDPQRVWAAHRLYVATRRADMPRVMGGRYRRRRLIVPARLLIGRRDLAVLPTSAGPVTPWADDMTVEKLDTGHAIVEERPDEVLERMVSFFAPDSR